MKLSYKTQKYNSKQESNITDMPTVVKMICYLMTTMLSISTLIPLLVTVSVSLTETKTLARYGYSLIPKKWSFEAYRYVLKNGDQLWQAYGVTIFVTVIGTLIGLFLMTMFAYSVSRRGYLFGNVFTFFAFFTMLFNAGMVPTYIVISNTLHLKDSIMALIFPVMGNVMYIMILRTYMRSSIPPAVVESAKIDGAGEYRCYAQIVLPMAVPAVATVALFVAVGYWNDWMQGFLYIVRNDDIVPIQLLLKRIEENIDFLANSTDISYADSEQMRQSMPTESFRMALVVMVVLPILISYPFFQKFFVNGITVGAVKG